MYAVDPDQKVAELINQHPGTYKAFKKHGCPDMRNGFFALMARIMSVRKAAWIHGIPLDKLLADLEESVSEGTEHAE